METKTMLPREVLIECKACGCRLTLTHERWVSILKEDVVQICPCCNRNRFIKVGCNY